MNCFKPGVLLGCALLMFTSWMDVSAKDVTIGWDQPQQGDDVAGYNVYLVDRTQTFPALNVGLTNQYTFSDLTGEGPFLIFVTAYNSLGIESDASTVLHYPTDAPCVITAAPLGTSVSAFRTSDSFFITTPTNCAFLTTTDDSWITVTGIHSSGGRTRVDYVVDSNRSPIPRNGFISTGGQVFSIQQDSGQPTPPFILKRLSNSLTVDEGQALQLSVEVEREDGPVQFQWLKDGVPILGATNSTFSKAPLSASDVGNYDVAVTNSIGVSTGGPVNVTLYERPRFIRNGEPRTRLSELGTDVSLFAVATGTDVSYSWTKDGLPLPYTLPFITIPSITEQDLGLYRVTISNRLGAVQSQAAYITTREFEQKLGRIHITVQSDSSLLVQGEGIPGAAYDILISNDLVQWRVADSVFVADGGLFTIEAPLPANQSQNPWFVRTFRRPAE